MAQNKARSLPFLVKEGSLHAVGDKAAIQGGPMLANSGLLSGFGLGASAPIVGTMGLTAAVSAGLAQLEYHHKGKELTEFYKDEVAATLKKPAQEVTQKDLKKMAQGPEAAGFSNNSIIREEMDRARKKRNLGIFLSVTASLATYALVALAGPLVFSALTGFTFIAAEGLAGLATYAAIKAPLHWIGSKMMNLGQETTHDRIAELQKIRDGGKALSREQVFSVFVSANPQLDVMIKKTYGRAFDDLEAQEQQLATQQLGRLLNIETLTDGINTGTIKTSELAFVADGQAIPVNRERPAAAVEYNNPVPEQSFVSRLGRAPRTQTMGYVEQLDAQQQADGATLARQ